MAILFFFALLALVGNLLSDLSLILADPRMSFESAPRYPRPFILCGGKCATEADDHAPVIRATLTSLFRGLVGPEWQCGITNWSTFPV